MYILPNKKPIKIKKLEKAFLNSDAKKKFYLDVIDGDVVSGQNIKTAENILNELRFFEVPKLPMTKKLAWMDGFIDAMLWGDDPALASRLKKTLEGESPEEKFMSVLSEDESGWIHGWTQWESDQLWEEITDWFCSLPIDIEDDMSELDDDCPLCRMMKEGNSSLEDLKEGFKKVKDNGNFVGGE